MEPSGWGVIISAILSGLFALASYSLRGYRRVQLDQTFGGTSSGRGRLALLERHLTALRLTSSFCRAMSNVVLVVAMVYVFDARTGGIWAAIGAVVSAGAIIAIFGVAIPHAWATYAGEKILYAFVRPLVVCRYALYPIAAIMQAFDLPVRRLCGIPPQGAENGNAKQEILQAATEGQAEGAVDADEVEMIESVIEFGETQAAEIMTPRTDVFALPVDTAWEKACEKVTGAGHTRVPVYEGDLDNIIGILYAKDLLRFTTEPKPKDVREIMRSPFFIPESKLLDDLLREFKTRQVHLAVVLDEYGGTAGLVTIEDVLEEIVGEITDEYDRTEPVLMEQIDEKTAQVDGRMYVDDLNDAMGLSLPEDEDYDTVAGLVFSELGYIPTEGEQLKAHGAEFTILAADKRKITKLKVQKLERQNPSP